MKRSEAFEVLDPPAHGWTRLKARVQQSERPLWRWALALAAVAAAVVLALLGWPARAPRVDVAAQVMRSTAAGTFAFDAPKPPLAVSVGAAEAVPSNDPRVLMYRVAMMDADVE